MVGDQIGDPRDVQPRDTVLDRRKLLPGSNSEQCRHGLLSILCGDDGSAAVDGGGGHRQTDPYFLARSERDQQFDVLGVEHGQRGAGLRMRGDRIGVDGPVGRISQACNGVLRHARGPRDVGSCQHDAQQSRCDLGVASAGDGRRLDTLGEKLVRGGLLEAVQQFAHRLVDASDTCDGNGSGDDADLIGGVASVVCLPQRVTAPPTAYVTVDDGNEVDRLAGHAAQRGEEGDVGRVQNHVTGVGELSEQRLQCCARTLEYLGVGEQGGDGATIDRVETCLGALQHFEETSAPGDVEPHRFTGLGHRIGELAATVEFAA
ncbi:unannotated protein [freshwater metagenome]|uniref:Unannotated protein n=1 Tax=freshwater metagenome TaxID=449393 RepID=A0A6J7HC02_9ZZZZ